MVTTLQASNSVGTGTRFTFDEAGDSYAILNDVVVSSVDVGAITGTVGSNNLRIDGTVIAEATAVFLAGGDNKITIGAQGVVAANVSGSGSAIGLGTASSDGGSLLTNFGAISAPGRIAVLAPRADIVNHGTIDGVSPVFLGVFGRAGATLTNTGIISAVGAGVDAGSRYNNAVFFEGNNGLLTNGEGGVISASFAGAAGVRFGGGDGSGGSGGRVNNAGEIISLAGVGIDASEVPAADGVTVINSGTITGGNSAIVGSNFTDDVTNLGDIFGNVRLNGGADKYRASAEGEVTGTVRGGNGADVLIGADADDTMTGDNGDDLLRGRQGDDDLNGGGGKDTIRGGQGDDNLTGAGAVDDLRGGDGDDSLNGGNQNDQLRGGRGEDVLIGGTGRDNLRGGQDDDSLFGGSEADRLDPGRGNDLMAGGAGNDVFVFAAGTGTDTITDFADGSDKIDVTDFGFAGFGQLNGQLTLEDTERGVRIIAEDGVLVIEGLVLADLNGADFIF